MNFLLADYYPFKWTTEPEKEMEAILQHKSNKISPKFSSG